MNKFKLILISFLSLIPIAVYVAGVFLKTDWMLISGLVIFALYAIVTFLMYLKLVSSRNQELSEETEETQKDERKNQTFNIVNSWNLLSRGERTTFVSLLFVVLCCFSLIIILIVMSELIYSLITFACLVVLIIAILITAGITSRISTAKRHYDYSQPAVVGEVISCKTYTGKTEITGDRTKTADKSEKEKQVVYKVKLKVEGVVKTSCSSKEYEKGTKVYVRNHKKFKNFVIIEE